MAIPGLVWLAHVVLLFKETVMPTDLEQLELIRSRALQQIADIRAEQKPSYSLDGQWVSWTAYVESLQATVDWCNRQLAGCDPFEVRSQAYTG
jgi:hypothetical protein